MKRYRVEVIKGGHQTLQLTIKEIVELQKSHYLICGEIAGTLRMLKELDEDSLEHTTRIVAVRPICGG